MNLSTWTSKQWPKASKVWELPVQSQGQSGIQLRFSWSSIICFWINVQNFILHSDTNTEMPTMIIIITSGYSVYPMHHASKKYPQLPQVGSLEISRERSDLKTKPLIAMWDPDQEFLLGSGGRGGGIKPNNSLLGIINKDTIYVFCMVAVLIDTNTKCTCKAINKFYNRK